ncbi:hypothetical protein CDAR_174211 [Caerostris darwini]|uniref:Uncharacterized protein n=1 Tax=Caerostris darwini TaxID=1538125 RepID=A0AAV4VIR8_9ARAC|nr:hypothetical protein CDAR_174211 [Caerostris darwini]
MVGFFPNYPNAPRRKSKTSFQANLTGIERACRVFLDNLEYPRRHLPASVSAADVSPSGWVVMMFHKINAGFLLPSG